MSEETTPPEEEITQEETTQLELPELVEMLNVLNRAMGYMHLMKAEMFQIMRTVPLLVTTKDAQTQLSDFNRNLETMRVNFKGVHDELCRAIETDLPQPPESS